MIVVPPPDHSDSAPAAIARGDEAANSMRPHNVERAGMCSLIPSGCSAVTSSVSRPSTTSIVYAPAASAALRRRRR